MTAFLLRTGSLRDAAKSIGVSILLLVGIHFAGHQSYDLHAQDGVVWTAQSDISQTFTYPVPKLTIDSSGRLHVFFHSFSPQASDEQYAIYHTQMDDDEWTQVIDVLYSVDGTLTLTDVHHFALTDEIYISGRSPSGAYIAVAYANEAHNPLMWTYEQIPLSGVNTTCMALSPTGTTVLVYSDAIGLHALVRDSGSLAWLSPVMVSEIIGFSAYGWCDAAVDQNDVVHLTWSESYGEYDWEPRSIWYARLPPGSRNVDEVVEMWSVSNQERVSHNTLQITPDGHIMVVWNPGVNSKGSRYYRSSKDGGISWGDQVEFFEGVRGLAGPTKLLWDSKGEMYALTAGESTFGTMRLLFARQVNGNWNSPQVKEHCEWLDATVQTGNQLHAVCGAIREPGRRVSYLSAQLPAPAAEPVDETAPPMAPPIPPHQGAASAYSVTPTGFANSTNAIPAVRRESANTPNESLAGMATDASTVRYPIPQVPGILLGPLTVFMLLLFVIAARVGRLFR